MQTNIIRRQDMTICFKKGPDQSHKDLSIIRYTIEEEKYYCLHFSCTSFGRTFWKRLYLHFCCSNKSCITFWTVLFLSVQNFWSEGFFLPQNANKVIRKRPGTFAEPSLQKKTSWSGLQFLRQSVLMVSSTSKQSAEYLKGRISLLFIYSTQSLAHYGPLSPLITYCSDKNQLFLCVTKSVCVCPVYISCLLRMIPWK